MNQISKQQTYIETCAITSAVLIAAVNLNLSLALNATPGVATSEERSASLPCPALLQDRPSGCGKNVCLNTKCGDFKVKVVIHEVRAVATAGVSRPKLAVAVHTDVETFRTEVGETGSNTSFEEEFILKASSFFSDINFTLYDDGVLTNKLLSRACVPLSTLNFNGELKQCWIELLPCESGSKFPTFRAGSRPGALRKPKKGLGFLCVSVLTSFNQTTYNRWLAAFCDPPADEDVNENDDSADEASPRQTDPDDREKEDFSSKEFLMHVNRLMTVYHEICPSLLYAIQEAPVAIKFLFIIPSFASMVISTTLCTMPFLCLLLLLLNTAVRKPYRQSDIVAYDDSHKRSLSTKMRRAYHTVPTVLRKIQRHVERAASFFEKSAVLTSFLDPSLSITAFIVCSLAAMLLSLMLALLPLRFIMFLIGTRIILFTQTKKKSEKKEVEGSFEYHIKGGAFKKAWRCVRRLGENFYAHVPDILEVEHRVIAVGRRRAEVPYSANANETIIKLPVPSSAERSHTPTAASSVVSFSSASSSKSNIAQRFRAYSGRPKYASEINLRVGSFCEKKTG